MNARVIRIDPDLYNPDLVREAREAVIAGGVVVFPTETFYGLGADAFSPDGIRRVYALKKRDRAKPLSVVIADRGAAESCARDLPPAFHRLAERFWPGPLTLVVQAGRPFPPDLLGPGGTIAVRVPGPAWLRGFIKDLGVPLTATSANRSGRGEISDPGRLFDEFQGEAVMIIDGGPTPGGKPSTILDLTADPPRILRPGAVSKDRIRRVLPDVF